MLYKKKAITKKFILRRTPVKFGVGAYCSSSRCSITAQRGALGRDCGCIDLCYKLSDFNSTYEQYVKHKLRYIGIEVCCIKEKL